jgi:hypothetical protein
MNRWRGGEGALDWRGGEGALGVCVPEAFLPRRRPVGGGGVRAPADKDALLALTLLKGDPGLLLAGEVLGPCGLGLVGNEAIPWCL